MIYLPTSIHHALQSDRDPDYRFDATDAEELLRSVARTDEKQKTEQDKKEHKALCCAHCLQGITDNMHAIEVNAQHFHTFANPAGVVYNIRLFAEANCQAEGPYFGDYSWFTGYAWRVVLCPQCMQHLGWSFQQGNQADFYGLISEMLIEVKDA